jgi:DNA-binding transcriptional MerR regulator
MTLDSLSVGEIAAQTGLTVPTLHHYDELGLLVPDERTQAGHRRYGAAEVERLYRIVALRRLGLSLGDVAAVLDGADGALEAVVRSQLDALDERIETTRRLRALLAGVLDRLGRAERPGVDDVLRAIEVTERMQSYYTDEQREFLRRRKEELGEEAIRDAERAWAEVAAELRAASQAGTDPADAALDPLRARVRGLLEAFHGGEESIQRSLNAMWTNEDPERLSGGMFDRELTDYMGRVMRAG